METTSRRTDFRAALLGGFVLILIGAAALVSELRPDLSRYLPLLLGAGLLVVFVAGRAYPALVAGAIFTGIGGGLLASDFFASRAADGATVVLGLGLGFTAIWLISVLMGLPERHWWPLVPGGILTTVGGGMALELVIGDVASLLAPAILVVLGATVMLIGFLGRRSSNAKQEAR